MAKKTPAATPAKKPDDFWNFEGAKVLANGSAVKIHVEWIEKNGGMVCLDDEAHFDGAKINIPGLMLCARILCDPTHRENQWACLAEKVRFGNKVYLRLVPSIPMWVKDEWSKTGQPPEYLASLDLERVMAGMTEKPQTATGKNPYHPGTKIHEIFAKASTAISKSELLDWIATTLAAGADDAAKRKNAHGLWMTAAKPEKNENRSKAEVTEVNGVEFVRLVALD